MTGLGFFFSISICFVLSFCIPENPENDNTYQCRKKAPNRSKVVCEKYYGNQTG